MTLKTTGSIAFSEIQSEFGGSNPISLSEYYAGGSTGYVPSGTTGSYGNIASPGNPINIKSFYGSSSTFVFNQTISSARTSYYNIMLEAIQAGWSGGRIVGTININANIYSAGSNFFPGALGSTSLPVGSNIMINIASGIMVVGKGGTGGDGDTNTWVPNAGSNQYFYPTPGGEGKYGLYFTSSCSGSTITVRNLGYISGGGGGGGGGANRYGGTDGAGGGGGGGANYGAGGIGGYDDNNSAYGENGTPGTFINGGTGGLNGMYSGNGGNGGGLGSSGYDGEGTALIHNLGYGRGGAGGYGVYGDNYITWYGGSRGTVYGGIANS